MSENALGNAVSANPAPHAVTPLDAEPIHGWFSLTYSSYLVIPRSILQSAPVDLQRRLVACLQELDAMAPDDVATSYWVRATDGRKFVRDPYAQYERGRRKVALKSPHAVTEPSA